MEPNTRKAWLADALAELRGRRRLSYTAIASAMGKSKQALNAAVKRDPPSEELIAAIAQAFPDLPRPNEPRVIQMNREGTDERMERMERAVNSILAAVTMISVHVDELLKDKK